MIDNIGWQKGNGLKVHFIQRFPSVLLYNLLESTELRLKKAESTIFSSTQANCKNDSSELQKDGCQTYNNCFFLDVRRDELPFSTALPPHGLPR